ncbi:thiamine pyrophosphate-dependent enzyme [Salinisphaera aquimarina]|uniref:Thiamine pyrophosphate-dependent enzyme n=1 Tax=Salinisphaera aquimarina TaxID=2094031 RepID=A0ABV7EIP7_9GAMM
MSTKHAGQVIVDSLALHDVKRVFAVPGESYLAVLDGLYDTGIETVVCRQEGGACYMAEAHGKLTGAPGVALVTRGPGAANASVAIHAAWQDATPLVLFIGLIPVASRQRESFQEFDPQAWFGTQTKRVFVLDQAERASEIVAEAFFAAQSGRPGPVVVGLPEDVITQQIEATLHPVLPVAEGAVSAVDYEQFKSALAGAERPLIFAGGPRWTEQAAATITRFAETNGIPVIHDWRATDRVSFDSPVNAGWLGYGRNETAVRMFADADVLLAIGAVPTDVPTDGYTLRQAMDATNILVNIDTALRGRSGAVAQHIVATPAAFAAAVEDLDLGRAADWNAWRSAGREAQAEASALPNPDSLAPTAAGTAHMSVVVNEIVARLPRDAIHCFGAGNHCFWAQRYLPTHVFPSQLSVRNGSMGYSVPAAVAASLECPERLIVAIAGDGEFLMNGQELATAMQYGAAMLIVVMDNQQYGTIRAHQEKHYPGRVSGTQLHNPDFAALMAAFGGHGETVSASDQAAGAVERALVAVAEQRRPALIHVITDQQVGFA